MPQYAGMPQDRSNYSTKPCGCETVRVGAAGNQPAGEMCTKHCAEHPPAVDENFNDRRSE